jgi:hypothetical protein
MNEEINETNAVDQQPNEQPTEQPSEQLAEDTQLSEEDLAFALWSLQVGSYLHSLVTGDPLAAADEFEATAKHLRQLAQPQQEQQPKAEPQPESQQEQAQPQPNIEELVQKAVQEALQQAMSELRRSALRSPNSLNAPPASARRLADLIE